MNMKLKEPLEYVRLAWDWTAFFLGVLAVCAVLQLILTMTARAEEAGIKEVLKFKCIGVREITSYNAVKEQTDGDPDNGAYGRVARNGVPLGDYFACNFLARDTRIVVPKISGNKIWVCKDRTAKKVGHRIDLLYPTGKSVGLRKEKVYVIER